MFPCSDPKICGVQNHRDGTICRATQMKGVASPSSKVLYTPPHPSGQENHRSFELENGKRVFTISDPSGNGFKVGGVAAPGGKDTNLSNEESAEIAMKLDNQLIEEGQFPISASQGTAAKVLQHNRRVRDYYVQDKVGVIADGVLDGKGEVDATEGAKDLSYVTRDSEAEIVWNLDPDEFDDVTDDRYDDLHEHLNTESTKIAQEQWRTISQDERQQILSRRAEWRSNDTDSTGHGAYEHQLDWSLGENI